METSATDCDEALPATHSVGRTSHAEIDSLDLDVLYDLAWHLVGDEREALELIQASLRPKSRHGSRDDEWHNNPQHTLTQSYLRRNRSPLRHLVRFVRGLKRHGKQPLAEHSKFEAGLGELCPEERVCLILRERVGLEVTDIARTTGIQSQRVSRVLFSARERLRTALLEL